ncbi:MAG: ribose-phosphate pyrophosphokinase [Candidatus Levybacteria bacterium]|nr:ribose-phosphate pyrophosphokinase [Candidatus Levybacteria bacterium]MBP9815389.1 ribose-phosphate pyrophosphokinase [Candidatus Levybacteria bacterium]
MKIFSGSANRPLAEKIAHDLGLSLSEVENHLFPDGERRIKLMESVVDEDVLICQPTCPPVDSNLMELCLLLDAAKRSGAKNITAIVPYLGYQRQDHIFRTGEARSLEVVVKMIEASGANCFMGIDLHSIKIPELFSIGVDHLSALPLFAEMIKQIEPDLSNACLVTPDMGGIRRIELLKNLIGSIDYVSVEKDRDIVTGEISVARVTGEVKDTCFIVDDMISSGGTIIQSVNELIDMGAKKVFVMATHAVFSDKAPSLLEDCRAEKIFVTDTIYIPKEKQFKKLEIVSVAPTIALSLSA